MSNLLKFFSFWACLFLIALLGLVGCNLKGSKDSLQEKASIQQQSAIPRGEMPMAEQDLSEEYFLAQDPLKKKYAQTLALAEKGDPTALTLCDSLLASQEAKADAEPYYYKGVYYSQIGDLDQAIRWFDKTIQTDYKFKEAYIEKASLLIEKNNVDAARKELETVRDLDPSFPNLYYWLGKWAEAVGKKQQAVNYYEQSLALDPSIQEASKAIERLQK